MRKDQDLHHLQPQPSLGNIIATYNAHAKRRRQTIADRIDLSSLSLLNLATHILAQTQIRQCTRIITTLYFQHRSRLLLLASCSSRQTSMHAAAEIKPLTGGGVL